MTNLHLGADLANDIRGAAAALAEIDNIADTGSCREILFDIAHALRDIQGPIGALLDREFTDGMDATKNALADAIAGIQYAADNI